MKLIETSFDNFRCFKNYKINYGLETTVIIGKNGTGKSSILSGIRRGLSIVFAQSKSFKSNLSISNNTNVRSFTKSEANFDSINRLYNYPISNSFRTLFNNEKLEWSLNKLTMNGGLQTSAYNAALNFVLEYYNSNYQAPLPVLVVYADSFPHKIINYGAKVKQILKLDILPRDFSYYGWDDRTNCTELWFSRFFKISNHEKKRQSDLNSIQNQIAIWQDRQKDAEENDHSKLNLIHHNLASLKQKFDFLTTNVLSISYNREKEYVENKLFQFTEPVTNEFEFINNEFQLFGIDVVKGEKYKDTVEFTFKDGRLIQYETLPMGYKRILSLVFDLAYRSYVLNEDNESEGVVLIDEIELHLHPTLQQEILQRLKKAFPKIQFIVTTHSPLVISNFKADLKNKLIKLEHEGNNYSNKNVDNIYGIDYTTGLMDIMDAKYRSSDIDNLIDSYVILKIRKNEVAAGKIWKEIFAIVGEDNERIKKEINDKVDANS